MNLLDDWLGVNKTTFEQALADYNVVRVLVMKHDKVVLPESVKLKWDEPTGTGLIGLDYGLNMPVPIDNFRITDEGVFAVLSFDRIPFSTFVPWEAMLVMAGDGLNHQPVPAKVRPKPKLKLV